jgi:hypothetical protein
MQCLIADLFISALLPTRHTTVTLGDIRSEGK